MGVDETAFHITSRISATVQSIILRSSSPKGSFGAIISGLISPLRGTCTPPQASAGFNPTL